MRLPKEEVNVLRWICAEVMKMTGAMETSFKLALKKPPSLRTAEVNKTIVSLISIALLMLAKITKLLLHLAVRKL